MHSGIDTTFSNNVLIVIGAQSSEEAELITGFLDPSARDMEVRVVSDLEQLQEQLNSGPDVLIVSIQPPEFSCQGVLEVFARVKQAPPVVFVGESADEPAVLDFLQHYAADFAFRDQLQHLRFAAFAAYRNSRILQQAGKEVAEKDTYNRLLNLQTAVDQSASTILITSTNGEIEYVNPAFERITGYSECEAIGKSPSILNSGYHSKEFFNEMWSSISSGKIWQGEMCNRRKDGALYWESATIAPVRDSHGVIRRFLAVKDDITARKAADDEVRASAERFERLARQSHTFTWEADPRGTRSSCRHTFSPAGRI